MRYIIAFNRALRMISLQFKSDKERLLNKPAQQHLIDICQNDKLTDAEASIIYSSQLWDDEEYRMVSQDSFKNTPILYAITTKKNQLAQLIANDMIARDLEDIIDKTDGWEDECGNTPLSLAIKMGYETLALRLLQSGKVDIHRQFRQGDSYLHLASIVRLDLVANALIRAGINQEQKNIWGIFATDYRHYEFTDVDLLPFPVNPWGNYLVLEDLNDFSFHSGTSNIVAINPVKKTLSDDFCKHIFSRYTHILHRYLNVMRCANNQLLVNKIEMLLCTHASYDAHDFNEVKNTLRDCIGEVSRVLESIPELERHAIYQHSAQLLFRQNIKAIIYGVIGALIGFVIGLVVGAVITSWGGGFGGFTGAMLGGVQGFTIGTGIGIGAAAVSAFAAVGAARTVSARSDVGFFSTREKNLEHSNETLRLCKAH